MNAESMSEEQIFTAALEIPTRADRIAYVRNACGADSKLRARVEALLSVHETQGTFLETPPIAGVLLYELLVGATPFDSGALRCRGYDEICQVIRESDPPTPSKRLSALGEAVTDISQHRHVEPAALRKLLHGDLDWIVMRCLEKDRTRRYETVYGLLQDVKRYLGDEPVHAARRAPVIGSRNSPASIASQWLLR